MVFLLVFLLIFFPDLLSLLMMLHSHGIGLAFEDCGLLQFMFISQPFSR